MGRSNSNYPYVGQRQPQIGLAGSGLHAQGAASSFAGKRTVGSRGGARGAVRASAGHTAVSGSLIGGRLVGSATSGGATSALMQRQLRVAQSVDTSKTAGGKTAATDPAVT